MEIDIIKLNRLFRFVSDAENTLITTAEGLKHIRDEIGKMRRVELARLDSQGIPPPPGELPGSMA